MSEAEAAAGEMSAGGVEKGVPHGLSLITAAEAGGGERETLSAWVAGLKERGVRVRGVIGSSKEGRRQLTRISSGETRALQLNEVEGEDRASMAERRAPGAKITEDNVELLSAKAKEWAEAHPQLKGEVVGPYVFDGEVLQWAREELTQAAAEAADCVVVDEAGPLEVKRGAGLEPALSRDVAPMSGAACVVIVCRDSLRTMLRVSLQGKAGPNPRFLAGFPPQPQAPKKLPAPRGSPK